jgi:glucose-1-phosphate cytidylyltransferase
MVPIGYRPILWHLMKYYAHFGHREFIICLGYRGDVIKQYFLDYEEALSNDFSLTNGGRSIELHSRDMDEWKITFVETGLHSNIGMRLKAVQKHLGDDPMFLANYADGLADLSLTDYLAEFKRQDKVATFLQVRPGQTFHIVSSDEGGVVRDIRHVSQSDFWINGGFFAFKREIFDYMKDGEELVVEPFQRLIAAGQLMAHRCDGFWQCMDTFRDKQLLDELNARGNPPWEVWKRPGGAAAAGPAPAGRTGPQPRDARR